MIAWWQIILLTLYAGFQIMDELHWYSSAGSAVFSGFITGLIMGDMATGLYIGGSMQLTILGVGTFGGASRIDANSGTLIATAFAVSSGMDPEQALAVLGVPVAAILVYTDIARDGMQTGIDVAAYRHVAQVAGFPVVASGGISTLDDIRALAAVGEDAIEGAITGRALYEGNFMLAQALATARGEE